jgi:VWFA-related protein
MRWMKFCAMMAQRNARQDSLRCCRPIIVFSLIAVFVFLLRASAQEPTLRSQSNIVLVPALVKDGQGGLVYGLDAKNFVIEDEGVEQTVRVDEVPEGQPVSLVIAIQTGRRARNEFERMKGLTAMLDPLFEGGRARVAIVEFGSLVTLARNFTTDETLIDADLSNLQAGDNKAAILDAINYSVDLLKKEAEGRERVLLLISETRDHGSAHKVPETVAAIGQSNALMYALSFSPGVSNILDTARGNNIGDMHAGINLPDLGYRSAQALRKNVPSAVVAMTGGEYELFASGRRFDMSMTSFTNHLHSRYWLSFAPKDPHPGLHQIRVWLKNAAGDFVLARTSYWAEGRE